MIHVLGLDVSMNSTGWAVLSISEGVVRYVDSGIIKAKTKEGYGQRLRRQRNTFAEIVDKYKPQYVAREAGFTRHVKATQVLFRAYGVTEEFFADSDLVEYAAATIKKVVGGSGKAEKDVVEYAVRERLKLWDKDFASDDESDAVAIALTLIIERGLDK